MNETEYKLQRALAENDMLHRQIEEMEAKHARAIETLRLQNQALVHSLAQTAASHTRSIVIDV